MVNKKPSTGCANCRQRHIKCDEARPGCQRCANQRTPCPGYRNVCGLIFVNNNKDFTRRHAKRKKHTTTPEPRQISAPCPSSTLPIDPDVLAVTFFFTQYVTSVERGSSSSQAHLSYIIPMYHAASPSSPLASATLAMAYRALNASHSDEIYDTKSHIYEMKACKSLALHISDSLESTRDETLMAVLCLDLAAHLSSRKQSRAANRVHIDGALALLRNRPEDSFNTEVARSLFAATRSKILLQSLWFGDQHALDSVAQLPKINLYHIDPVVNLQHLLAMALTLEQQISTGYPSRQEQEEQMALALSMDIESDDWLAQVPSAWTEVYVRPRKKGLPSSILVQAAYALGLWHCTKVLILKLVYATTHEPGVLENLPLRLQKVLYSLQGICDYLADDSAVTTTATQRPRSSVVVVARGGPFTQVDSASEVQNCRLDLLRWIVDEMTEECPARGGLLLSQGDIVQHFRIQLACILSSLVPA